MQDGGQSAYHYLPLFAECAQGALEWPLIFSTLSRTIVMSYKVIAIPLNRPPVISFLTQPPANRQGAPVYVVGQRPTPTAERAWLERLQAAPSVTALLQRDDPHNHLIRTTTDRLIPDSFLQEEDDYLTRNLGGWTAIYFGVITAVGDWQADPMLSQATMLADYGDQIQFEGPDVILSTPRLEQETGCQTAAEVTAHITTLVAHRDQPDYFDQLYHAASGKATLGDREIPQALLLDAMLGEVVRQESRRRAAIADGDEATRNAIETWARRQQDAHGVRYVFKSEYIMGRHRRSAVLILPELNAVIKQPAPEPFHEADIGAQTYQGKPENWPMITDGGRLVTAGGRIRLTLENGKIALIDHVFQREIAFNSIFGIIIEPFVKGPTLQDYVLEDPRRLTPQVYEEIVLHQQVCELLDADNNDWHSANFIVNDGDLVHIDWGAARPMHPDEHTPSARQSRLDQVRNLAFSFHDPALAEKINTFHAELTNDPARLHAIRDRARHKIRAVGAKIYNDEG
jgi:hypothetical protein